MKIFHLSSCGCFRNKHVRLICVGMLELTLSFCRKEQKRMKRQIEKLNSRLELFISGKLEKTNL